MSILNFKFQIFNSARQRGYTLVEILIGLTILTLLFVGGYTAYRDFTRRQIIINTAEELKANISQARVKALTAERPDVLGGECGTFLGYVAVFSPSSYVIKPDCDPTDPGPLSSYYKTYSLPPGVSVSVSNAGVANQILFKPLGAGTDVVNENGATITVSHRDSLNTQMITVYPSGAIK